ncbi:HepT-like ribonuclease domain-containing protein [Rhizobium terrae]|uniref:HepT-like ribonuclease domain-containing protein n=1 Tax=Rhizobium terrae TaxID=2171756 RepID=UPI000E3B70AB|nr:DUF86 domain-containing protein [Rhizobium terrae]
MSENRLHVYLERMRMAGVRAIGYVSEMGEAAFRDDLRTRDAVTANIAAIGECVTKIMDNYPDFVVEHPDIPWRDIRAMRNRVAHQYFDVDVETVWLTVKIKIPELLKDLDSLHNWRAQGE